MKEIDEIINKNLFLNSVKDNILKFPSVWIEFWLFIVWFILVCFSLKLQRKTDPEVLLRITELNNLILSYFYRFGKTQPKPVEHISGYIERDLMKRDDVDKCKEMEYWIFFSF